MKIFSDYQTRSAFLEALKSDPELVFVRASLGGRISALTLGSIMDLASDVLVEGPRGEWRVAVHRSGKSYRAILNAKDLREVRRSDRSRGR